MAPRLYWPGLRSDCQAQVSSCLQCLRYNVGKSGYHTRQYITAELPFDHIAMDTITGFPTTERGNNVILVITDLCTRFKLLLPQQTKSAAEMAANVWKVFCTFPFPKIVQSDNGTEFCNQVIKSLFDLYGADHRTIAAYNPRANGSAENAVRSCQQVLRKLTNGNMKDWDDFPPSAQLALNSKATIRGSLRATFWAARPYSTTTGRHCKLRSRLRLWQQASSSNFQLLSDLCAHSGNYRKRFPDLAL